MKLSEHGCKKPGTTLKLFLQEPVIIKVVVFLFFVFGFCCRPLVQAAFFSLDATLDISIVRKSGAPRFEPGAAG